MSMPVAAALLYAVVILYLVARRVEPRLIARIVGGGLTGGLALAYSLGIVYFLIVFARPAETISVMAMASLLFCAAYFGREHILETITPAGIVLLNVAANLAPAQGPLPLSLYWLAGWIPVPYGPQRVALNLLVLYLPTLLALWLLLRGPPGRPLLRYVLGVWVMYVGIAAIVGPGWHLVSDFRIADPGRWLASSMAAYAAIHVVMLALNLVFSVSDDSGEAAASIARSVRVDRMRPLQALGFGAAFWVAAYLFARLPTQDYDLKAAIIVAAAFGLGTALAAWKSRSEPEADAGVAPRDSVGSPLPAAKVLVFAAVFGGFALWAWRSSNPGLEAASRMWMSPATGMQATRAPGMVLAYREPHLHARLKDELTREGVPFSTYVSGGREYLRVAEEHRDGVKRATLAIEGRDVPGGRNVQFRDSAREKQFTEWLTAKGVKWERVRKRDDSYIVWDAGPRHDWLLRAFEDGRQFASWLGVDYHALYVVAALDPFGEEIKRTAAFDTDEQRESFIAWLRQRGVAPRTDVRGGRTFVTWQGEDRDLLGEYKRQMQAKCYQEHKATARPEEPARC